MTTTSCWSSVLALISGHAEHDDNPDTGEEKTLRRRLLADWAAAAAEKEETKKLTAEVQALERALASANSSREAAEKKRRDAEARAEAAEAELRAAAARQDAQVEELRRALDAQEDSDARIQELEERIRELNNATSKWRFF